MKSTLLSFIALATTSLAVSSQIVENYCIEDVYLTITKNGAVTGPFVLPANQAYISNITGLDNDFTLSKNSNIYLDTTAKLVLGTSTDNGVLYWSINDESGDPFAGEHFSIESTGTTPNVCGSATGYDNQVHACQDQEVTLTLNLCSGRMA